MARPVSEKVGRGTCPQAGCGAAVTYRKSTGGLLTHRCDQCDSTGFAEPGGEAYKLRMATIKRDARPDPEPAPAPPAGKRGASSVFDLGALAS